MIFMRDGRTKQRKDAIAQGLRHIALVAMHGIHHELQRRVDNRAGFFGIEAFNQRRGAFEIGKERGDRLTLTVVAPRASNAACSARIRSARWAACN